MDRPELAESLFRQGFACAQAVLAAHAGGELALEPALKLGEGFAAGICGLGHVCGAVAGAVMVIGLRHGRTRPDDLEARDDVNRRVRALLARFEARHGSSECRVLLGQAVDTPERRQAARDSGLFQRVCPPLVRSAAELLEDALV